MPELFCEWNPLRSGTASSSNETTGCSSLNPKRLTAAQWLLIARRHWAVENENHNTFDTAFKEDDRPWIEADANGMLVVLLLRRIAYTMLALFRSVTLRSEKNRAMRWKDLLAWVRDTLVGATASSLAGLRPREVVAATL